MRQMSMKMVILKSALLKSALKEMANLFITSKFRLYLKKRQMSTKMVISKVSHATSYMSYEALTWLGGCTSPLPCIVDMDKRPGRARHGVNTVLRRIGKDTSQLLQASELIMWMH